MSYRVYPVVPTAPACDDYRIKINGEEVTTNTARVSAVPFNRRWPGHQRQIEQSEAVQFLSLATDEPLCFEITPREPFEAVKIRPQSQGITPTVEDGTIRFVLEKPAYVTVEPYGRHRALHIFADPMPHYDVDPASPDVLYFGPGEHDVGLLELKSHQTLFLDEGAVVYACVRAIDAEDIRILGRGILDNSRNREEILFESNVEDNHEAVNNAYRRHTIELEYCTGIEIDGITIRDSLVYNVRPVACRGLCIRNVKIIGCWRFNSDGIDMHNCVGVRISDCFLRTFDDSICVKGFDCYFEGDVAEQVRRAMYRNGEAYDIFEDVLVERCVIWNDWNKALEIGAETKAEEIRDVTFCNCDLIHLTLTALDCINVDYADVHDVTFRDINIECDEEIPAPLIQKNDQHVYVNPTPDYMPCTISVAVVYHHEYSKGSEHRRGRNRRFRFENIRVLGDKSPRVKCVGYDAEHKTEDICITNLYLNGEPVRSLTGENWEIGDFAENVRLTYDPYLQMEKNDVSAEGQLAENERVKFDCLENNGARVLFVGNSITLHGINEGIGWSRECGMAASLRELDYVHRLERTVLAEHPTAAFGICQVADWERQYKEGEKTLPLYREARRFGADVIVLRMVENCPGKNVDPVRFREALAELVAYLDAKGKAKVIVTTGFWRHPLDDALRAFAAERGYPTVELGDLGEDDAMKAIGLFEHKGVANHPGDLGMEQIAARIAVPLLPMLRALKH